MTTTSSNMKSNEMYKKLSAPPQLKTNAYMRLLTPPDASWTTTTSTMVLTMLAQTSSIFIPMLLLIISVVDFETKGLWYIGALTLATILYRFLTNTVASSDKWGDNKPHTEKLKSNPACRMYTLPFLQNKNLENQSISTFILVFTLSYIICPMIEADEYNMSIIGIIMGFILLDICWKVYSTCTSFMGVLTGLVTGVITGILMWYILTKVVADTSLVYYGGKNRTNTCKVKGDVRYTCDFEDEDDSDYVMST